MPPHTHPRAPNPQLQSPFFSTLSPEIRLLIYEYLIASTVPTDPQVTHLVHTTSGNVADENGRTVDKTVGTWAYECWGPDRTNDDGSFVEWSYTDMIQSRQGGRDVGLLGFLASCQRM